jgi:hypothetical protein
MQVSSRTTWGVLLIIVGIVAGGNWTFAMFVGESLMIESHANQMYYGTILTAAATLALIVSGVLVVRSRTAKHLATAGLWLIAAAAAGYVFGFTVCLVAH